MKHLLLISTFLFALISFGQPDKWFDEGCFPETFDINSKILIVMPDECSKYHPEWRRKGNSPQIFLKKKLNKKHPKVQFHILLMSEFNEESTHGFDYVFTFTPGAIHNGARTGDVEDELYYYFTLTLKDLKQFKVYQWKNKHAVDTFDGFDVVRTYFFKMFKETEVIE